MESSNVPWNNLLGAISLPSSQNWSKVSSGSYGENTTAISTLLLWWFDDMTADNWNSWVMIAIVTSSTELYSESYMFTSPFTRPMFDARIQWSPQECITWSWLGKTFRTPRVFFACRTVGWRPLRCRDCCLSSCWAKPTWQSVSFFPLRMISVSIPWLIHVCVFFLEGSSSLACPKDASYQEEFLLAEPDL